ncbi:helicase-exonuclease AddAB subunit AddA [Streptococcus danieliae]|uniref:DNA 3'-5' helicase n=1 Tax=Streptococcus danieliae TaxID=747656 RepID=A0A7Z0M6J0_9STRE|nr:helicase-exonuclease AddAB subunit AddA [Streptococcus danieliae]MBF0699644.1 helicase-exonuclease AddAB subunit AddA [Streptococcus danieliae]NYS96820.1 helicase-exonuclease AddAB subunit AddA [Streptococcus danieliae]
MKPIAFLNEEEIRLLQEQEAQLETDRKRTPEQILAIYSSGQNILVSASAGSGKTFVMVERILDQLSRGIGINQLFVSTFTVKAAGELKERLQAKLTEKLGNPHLDPQLREHLLRQRQLLPLSDIGTMDAFNQKLLAREGYRLSLSPNFRILSDPSELLQFQKEVFSQVFESYSSGSGEEDFYRLVTNFTGQAKDIGGFRQVVYQLADFMDALPQPLEWLEQAVSAQEPQALQELVRELYPAFGKSCLAAADQLYDLTQDPDYKMFKKDGQKTAVFLKHEQMIEGLRLLADQFVTFETWDEIEASLNQVLLLLPKTGTITVAKVKYDFLKPLVDQAQAIQALPFILEQEEEVARLLEALKAFVKDYYQALHEAKLAENAFTFSDVSHLVLRLLRDFPDLRADLVANYHEVMIDEYQDTNSLQEEVLELISNGHNRFMVGDIKQSIYRFRQAEPEIFNQKFKLYQEHQEQGCLILLKENFRSQESVLTATNGLFKHLMDEEVGEIDYNQVHFLVAGSPGQKQPEQQKQAQCLIFDQESEGPLHEGHVLVAQIQALHESGVAYKDICVLVESRTRNKPLVDLFYQWEIPFVEDQGQGSYLQAVEVIVMLDTLRTLYNPLQDYALLALLKSPMFGFDEDQLARIALQEQIVSLSFFEKLKKAQAGTGAAPDLIEGALKDKIQHFLEYLEAWRAYAKLHSLYDLIWAIYNQRHYYDYVGALPDGAKRQANLYSLALRARQFEQGGFKGLARFIDRIEKILAADKDLADVVTEVDEDAVQILTIHKSKGLEFPYVFIYNLDKDFNSEDLKKRLLLSRDLGIGIQSVKLLDTPNDQPNHLQSVRLSVPSLTYQRIQQEKRRQTLSEEMRLLYVAMTRAEKQLFLVGRGKASKLAAAYPELTASQFLPASDRLGYSNFQDWILAVTAGFPSFKEELAVKILGQADIDLREVQKDVPTLPLDPDDLKDNRQSEQLARALDIIENVDRLNTLYQPAIQLPTVRTPSQMKELYQPVFDLEGMAQMVEVKPQALDFSLPALGAKKSTITASQLGSSLHAFMQGLDLSQGRVDEALLQDRLQQMKLEPALAKALPLTKVLDFFQTELGQLFLANPDRLYREAPFAMLQTDVASGEEFVVRGILDGYLLFEDRIVLFDYKTDRYRNPARVADRYRGQMGLYAQALRQSYGISKVETYLILLGGSEIQVVALVDS